MAGRPTKYTEELQVKFDKAIDAMQGKEEFFNELPIMSNIAYLLEVSESTLYQWAKTNDVFLESIKRWRRKRNSHFIALAPQFKSHPTMWIFWAKNILRFEDVHKIQDSSGEAESEPQQFRMRALRVLENAERSGVDPAEIQEARMMLEEYSEEHNL